MYGGSFEPEAEKKDGRQCGRSVGTVEGTLCDHVAATDQPRGEPRQQPYHGPDDSGPQLNRPAQKPVGRPERGDTLVVAFHVKAYRVGA